ncbi:DUF2612 domain-containing protein [Alphaproteobacteria bacterium]|nr:DUF2612 domain-containing protein [Alphaproteobacteria bacterium]
MKTDCLDHPGLALCRLITQYQCSDNLKTWISLQADQRQAVDIALCQMFLSFDKDNAIGRQLDTLGEIVGVNRIIENGEEKTGFFGFRGYPTAEAFNQGFFRGDPDKPLYCDLILTDAEFRSFICAQILRNMARATEDEFLSALEQVFGVEFAMITLDHNERAVIHVEIGQKLTSAERSLIRNSEFFPRPAGVRIESLKLYETPFGFQGHPRANSFDVGEFALGF